MASERRRWSDEDTESLRAFHAAGDVSLREAGRRLGWSIKTVVDHAKALGLDWSRPETAAAAEARRADGRRRRAALAEGLVDDMEKLRERIFAETLVYNFGGKDNTYSEATVPEPPHADKLKLIQAIGAAAATIERFHKLDADSGVPDAIGMLDQIAQAIKEAALDPAVLRSVGVEGADLL